MGRTYGPWTEYKCFNDCRQEGCPGHKVREVFCRSSDVLSFEFDDGTAEYWDLNRWEAMKKAEQAAREDQR